MADRPDDRAIVERAVQGLSEGHDGVRTALVGVTGVYSPPRFLKAFHGALDTEQCESAAWYPSLDRALEKIERGDSKPPDAAVEVGGLWVSKATGSGHTVRLRIERYAVRDKDVPLTERDMLWLWRDDVWKHDKALQHRRRRLRHLLEAAEKLSERSGADSCWVVYPVELELEREIHVLSPIASEYDVALDSFDLSIALGFYALLRGIKRSEDSSWWATGALATGDGSGRFGAPVKEVTELDAKSCALVDAGEARLLLYPAANGACPADAGIAAGMQDRATAVETLGEAVAALHWPLPDQVPHPRNYARWARRRTRTRIDEMSLAGEYVPAFLVPRPEQSRVLRRFLAQDEYPLLLVEGSSGSGKSSWLADEAARLLEETLPETAVVLASARDMSNDGMPEDVTPKLADGENGEWIAETAARGATIIWLIDGVETESDTRQWVEDHVTSVTQALEPSTLSRLKVVLVGQLHAITSLLHDTAVADTVYDPGPVDATVPRDQMSIHRPTLRIGPFTEFEALGAYELRRSAWGCRTPWHMLSKTLRKVLTLPVMGRVFHELYAGQWVDEALGFGELLSHAVSGRLQKRLTTVRGLASERSTRALLGALAAHIWRNPDSADRLTKARVATFVEDDVITVTCDPDRPVSVGEDDVYGALRLALSSGLLREVQVRGMRVLRFEHAVWPAYFLAAHIESVAGSAGEGLLELTLQREPGEYGAMSALLLAERVLSDLEGTQTWSRVLASGARTWSWKSMIQAWIGAGVDVQAAASRAWSRSVSPDLAVGQVKHWGADIPLSGRIRIAIMRSFWIPALRAATGIGDTSSVGGSEWHAAVSRSLEREPKLVEDLAGGCGQLGYALRRAWEAREAVVAHEEEVELWRAMAAIPVRGAEESRAWETSVFAALARDSERVRRLLDGLGALGQALRSATDIEPALLVHREAECLCRARTGIQPLMESGEAEWKAQLDRAIHNDIAWVEDLSVILGKLGESLRSARELQSSVAAHREAVEIARAICAGTARDSFRGIQAESQCGESLSSHECSRTRLSIELRKLGQALCGAAEPTSAVEVLREAVKWDRDLSGIPSRELGEDSKWDEHVAAAIDRETEGVRDLSISLGSLGIALRSNRDLHSAAMAHREEVHLKRALVGVPERPRGGSEEWDERSRAAVVNVPDRVQDLAIGIRRLGQVLSSATESTESVTLQSEAVLLLRRLAEVPALFEIGRTSWRERASSAITLSRPKVRDLAIGLGKLGLALIKEADVDGAIRVIVEEVELKGMLAGLPARDDGDRGGWRDHLLEATTRYPERARELSIGLGRLGDALRLVGRVRESVRTHAEGVFIKRLLARIPSLDEVGSEEYGAFRRQAVSQRPERVMELSKALGRLGQALRSATDVEASVRTHGEEVDLRRALASIPSLHLVGPSVWEGRLRSALLEYPGRVRDLSIALGRLGQARLSSGDERGAVTAHREEVAIRRTIAGVALMPPADSPSWSASLNRLAQQAPERLADLWNSLGNLGLALEATGDWMGAVGAHRESVTLCREVSGIRRLCNVSREAWQADVQNDLARAPARTRGLAVALGRLGEALRKGGAESEAVAAHEEEVALCRLRLGRAGSEPDNGGSIGLKSPDVSEGAPEQVRDLAIGLRRLGLAMRASNPDVAVLIHEESVAVVRRLGARPSIPLAGEPETAMRADSLAARAPHLAAEVVQCLSALADSYDAIGRADDAAATRREAEETQRHLPGSIGPIVGSSE